MKPTQLTVLFMLLLLALGGCRAAQPAVLSSAASTATTVTTAAPTATTAPEQPTLAATASEDPSNTDPSPIPTASALPTEASPQPGPTATAEPTPETAVPVTAQEPAQQEQPDEAPPQPGGCQDVAAFFADVTVPDDTAFKQSVDFEKVWRIRNEGTCAWEGYNLIWAGGSVFDAPLSSPILATAPGELVDISVPMRSPNQGGVFTSYWEFENAAGERFGVNSGGIDLVWVRISVSWYPEGETQPGSSPLPAPSGGCTIEQNPAYVDQLLALINGARQQNGLPPYTLDDRLSAAALAHSSDMACQDFVDHTGSDGSGWKERIQAAGYRFSYATENIYVGNPAFSNGAQGAFDWWMNSEIHRNNILSAKVTHIGIGYAYNENSAYKGHYTLNFAKP